jgi:hypothetical protein
MNDNRDMCRQIGDMQPEELTEELQHLIDS